MWTTYFSTYNLDAPVKLYKNKERNKKERITWHIKKSTSSPLSGATSMEVVWRILLR